MTPACKRKGNSIEWPFSWLLVECNLKMKTSLKPSQEQALETFAHVQVGGKPVKNQGWDLGRNEACKEVVKAQRALLSFAFRPKPSPTKQKSRKIIGGQSPS